MVYPGNDRLFAGGYCSGCLPKMKEINMMLTNNKDCDGTIEQMQNILLGPTRFMLIGASIDLGIYDILREHQEISATELLEKTAVASADSLMQLMQFSIKLDLVKYENKSDRYSAAELANLSEADYEMLKIFYKFVKEVCLRQVFYLPESLKTGALVGLKELFNIDGIFYETWDEQPSLKKAWSSFMNKFTSLSEGWFYSEMNIAANAKVIDLAGNTGLGATLIQKAHPGKNLHVTSFDFPFKEEETLQFFIENGMQDRCFFQGGDVFDSVPAGYDVVVISHFLDMFDKKNVIKILNNVFKAINANGSLYILVPIYSENLKDCQSVDFMPAYFLGCTMGQGGPQKLSQYCNWLQECGFSIEQAEGQRKQDIPALAPLNEGFIHARKIL